MISKCHLFVSIPLLALLLAACGKEQPAQAPAAAAPVPMVDLPKLQLKAPQPTMADAQRSAQDSGLLLLSPGDKLDVPVHPGNAEKTLVRTAKDGTTEIVLQAGGKESVYRQVPQTPEIRNAARAVAMDQLQKMNVLRTAAPTRAK